MKKMILKILSIAIGVCMLQFSQAKDDPYFFLNPKVYPGQPIEQPIKLYQQGEKISLVFWYVPQPKKKLLGVISTNTPSPEVMIKVRIPKDYDLGYAVQEIFQKTNLEKKPMVSMKLFKINDDLSESLSYEKKFSEFIPIAGSGDGEFQYQMLFGMMQMSYPYKRGQYRVELETLSDIPDLNNDQLQYFLYIRSHAIK